MKISQKITLFSLSLAGLAMFILPQSAKAFELQEVWRIKGGVQYQDGKILRFNNGHDIDIKALDLPTTEKIEWKVTLDGQDQTVNFLAQEVDRSNIGEEGRYLNFYVPYGYRGDIKVEAKSGNEVKTWSTKVVDDVYHDGGKRGYYHIKESNDQYTYLDTKWDYQTKTYTATLPETVNGQKVFAWAEESGGMKLVKPGVISHSYKGGGAFRTLYPIVKAESWLNRKNSDDETWYYQKQGQLVQNAWVKDNGTWYFMNDKGVMFNQTWFYQGGNWYAFKSSGAMIASDWLYDNHSWYYLRDSGSMATGWIKDSGSWYYLRDSGAMTTGWVKDGGQWYYLDSTGKMLHNTYTPDGYYVDASGAWK
ncbi:N-acetylmuramoyl-L-alanine amidase family protein [uncultured Streptococcus sp.]|uniref:N-acetylmuramoyl-L-alanine amidase family protein n=1 Tax=uncultured Streptococcus sp. TaxID=83427 RepID=UPI0028D8BCD7|nr:N-acetylmuramoyl-L-alanine amidase family protein [uncultured Streptococcus sp.]